MKNKKEAWREEIADTEHHAPSSMAESRVNNADATKNTWMITVRHWQAVEATAIIAIAIIIWGLFSLPSLLYLKRNPERKVCNELNVEPHAL